MTTTPTSTGLRTSSRLTITVDVAHDGDPELLARHLALELEAMIDRAPGLDLMDGPDATGLVLSAGDEHSADLPAWH